MLSQTGEQQRTIILDPKVPLSRDKLAQTAIALWYHIRWLKMFRLEPLPVASAHGAVAMRIALHAQEKVDGCLLVGIL